MWSTRIGYVVAALLLMSCSTIHMFELNNREALLLSRSAKEAEILGRSFQCLADLSGEDPTILEKVYKVADDALLRMEDSVIDHVPLSDNMIVNLEELVLSNALNRVRTIDERCSEVFDYCAAAQTPKTALELAELGKILIVSGTTMKCLLAQPRNSEVIAKFAKIFRKYINREVEAGAHITPSAMGIFMVHEKALAEDLQAISQVCANVAKKCTE